MEKHHCQNLLGSLSDFIDGSLSADLCVELEQHLAECENCRIVVDTLQKTIYLYHATATTPDVPSEVRERLFHRLDLDDYLIK
jgi:anti-sigma factor (TIGR02949 family)